jgi:Winged helix-turn helix
MPIPLRSDFDAAALRRLARQSKDGPQARRLLALAAIYEGATRTEAARIGGVTLQIVRDWVIKFNAQGPGGLIDRKLPGQASRLTDVHRTALMARIDESPIPSRAMGKPVEIWFSDEARVGKRTRSPGAGPGGDPSLCAEGPAHVVGLHRRSDLSGSRQGRRSGPAPLHHLGDEPAPQRDFASRRARRSRGRPARPGGLASIEAVDHPRQHHAHAASRQGSRPQPGRECLAVPARELAVEPDLPLLRGHSRPLLEG